ncbi:hypothetical protein AGR3A_Cc250092 [Agrobacterium tomkonis CFBP 6623]|uniref:Uncharacterized protein n=1 Tax=Agrobacterium tomkonis CFBP 6623 TaxID=1183432 RepID=A0A1S7PD80_9HYPH|nr:hypothetical protein AGR3A_Cc250092 [Agrobacterium tomkonis CFBP 6623]
MEHSSFREYLSRAAICRPLLAPYQVAAAKQHFNGDRRRLKLCQPISGPEIAPATRTNLEAHAERNTPAFLVADTSRRHHCRNSSHFSHRT